LEEKKSKVKHHTRFAWAGGFFFPVVQEEMRLAMVSVPESDFFKQKT
jgi:hypothetical protein